MLDDGGPRLLEVAHERQCAVEVEQFVERQLLAMSLAVVDRTCVGAPTSGVLRGAFGGVLAVGQVDDLLLNRAHAQRRK